MRIKIIASAVVILGFHNFIQGCAGTTPISSAPCPATLSEYKAGEATADEVKRCLGKPVHEDHNPDGRFVHLYQTKNGQKVAFLFDSSGKLIRIRGYTANQ